MDFVVADSEAFFYLSGQFGMRKKEKRPPTRCLTVATAHTERGLRQAAALRSGTGVDLVEVRLDCLCGNTNWLGRSIEKIKIPLILTARHPREGGFGDLGASRREELLEEFLPLASMVDIELRSVRQLGEIIDLANKRRIGVIISSHDFSGTPPLAKLRTRLRESLQAGATLVKIAATLRGPRDLASLIVLQSSSDKLAAMGMGKLGKVSRLVLPCAGARLVYGYLDRPQVEGQLSAVEIAQRLAELSQ